MSKYSPQIIENDRRILADKMISENEALTYRPYLDSVGKMSIGYGRNLDDRGITYQEAELMKANDIEEVDRKLRANFGFYRRLSPVRQAVLIDMVYNLGWRSFTTFRGMLSALAVSNWKEAAYEICDSKYWEQVGPRAKRNWYMMSFDRFISKENAQQYWEDQKDG